MDVSPQTPGVESSRPPLPGGWVLAAGAALLSCAAALGLEMRAASIEERLDAIPPAPSPVTVPTVVAPPGSVTPPTAAVPIDPPVASRPPELVSLEAEVEALEGAADEAGLPEAGGTSTRRKPVPVVVAGADPVGPTVVAAPVDPRVRAAARERAEREIDKERALALEKKRQESETKRQEMLTQIDMMQKMFSPDRAPKMAEKLMAKLGIAPEHRAKVEAALDRMAMTISVAMNGARTKVTQAAEITDESMQTIFASSLGMAYMGAISAVSKELKDVLQPDQRTGLGQAIQEAMQPDPQEMQELQGGAPASSDAPPPEPVEEEQPK